MDGGSAGVGSRSIKKRLGLKGLNCCGATWRFRPSSISVLDDDYEELPHQEPHQEDQRNADQTPPARGSTAADQNSDGVATARSGMNLAAALAAERHFRAVQDSGPGEIPPEVPGTPMRVSLIKLLEETDGGDGEREPRETDEAGVGCDSVCCVCMGRKRGAAFIPCGHTFCRVCSRELWLNRGTCPLCNHSILEILDIF